MSQISLKAARVNAGLTQAQAGDALHVSIGTIKNWEAGKTFPKQPQIMQLCELYGVSYDALKFS